MDAKIAAREGPCLVLLDTLAVSPAEQPRPDRIADAKTTVTPLGDFASDAFWRDFRFVRRLGGGTFGETYLAHPERSPHVLLVLKIPRDGTIMERRRNIEFLRSEANLLSKLFHPGIVRFRNFVYKPDTEKGSKAYLAMDYAEGGSLDDRLKRHSKAGTVTCASEIARIILSILQTLEYLHLRRVLHLDIK